MHGYERIPSVLPTPPGGSGLTHAQQVRRTVADLLAAQGLFEVWSAPFVGEQRLADLGLDVEAERARTVRIANPLSDEQPLMRTSLISTMVDALRRNVSRGAKDLGLFEVGLVTALDGPQRQAPTVDVGVHPSEAVLETPSAPPSRPSRGTSALLLAGDRDRAGWWGAGRRAELTDVLEVVDAIGQALAVDLVGRAGGGRAVAPGPVRPRRAPDGTLVGHAGRAAPPGRRGARSCRSGRSAPSSTSTSSRWRPSRPSSPARSRPTRWPRATSRSSSSVRCRRRACGESLVSRRAATCSRRSSSSTSTRVDQVAEGRKSLALPADLPVAERTLTTEEVSRLRDEAVAAAAHAHGAVQRA